ncbi:MAG: T9SS type A sorting domain-containing protein [Flavobacteriales bacterium]|nr:T9SS type A sorting domain-containing protein [Flavobacteriales bacterium]MCB9178805.1 T9SS type A sorting domain-containing protein [Flavobacteriales bacterium]HPF91411.1 T9SS type A sorting domain-containing protein [Flavobacteriales bacterium]
MLVPAMTSAQCSVNSSNGYSVNIQITLRQLLKPSSCPNGYNYNLRIGYTVTFSGSNIPGNLYTLQGRAYCGDQDHFFSMPTSGGTGIIDTGSNPWRGVSDCSTATLSSLGCRNVVVTINGPGIPNQQVNCTAALLPIHLVAFDAEAATEGVKVSWTTAMEQDNERFTVERSLDGERFETALEVPTAGNGNAVQDYSVVDPWSFSGTAYYRLRQTDLDGTETVFDMVAVDAPTRRNIRLHPNPVESDRITITGELTAGRATITDATGKVVYTGMVYQTIDVSQLPSGTYALRLLDAEGRAASTATFTRL